MLKALNRGVNRWQGCVRWHGNLEKHKKTSRQVWSSLYTRKVITKSVQIYQRISLFSFQKRCYAKCLGKRNAEKYWNQNGRCGIRPGCNITDQIFTLKQILEKSWEYAKDVFEWFVDLEKHITRFLKISSWECCRSMALMGICWCIQ